MSFRSVEFGVKGLDILHLLLSRYNTTCFLTHIESCVMSCPGPFPVDEMSRGEVPRCRSERRMLVLPPTAQEDLCLDKTDIVGLSIGPGLTPGQNSLVAPRGVIGERPTPEPLYPCSVCPETFPDVPFGQSVWVRTPLPGPSLEPSIFHGGFRPVVIVASSVHI